MKTLIKGYYGFGNLGDDILMIASYNLIKDIFPDAEIFIFSNAKNPSYIRKYIKETIQIVDYSSDIAFDLIFHGGGGVHYDFRKGDLKHHLLNIGIRLLGYKWYAKLFSIYKNARKNPYINGKSRIGMGIGVGTFTRSSKKFYSNIVELFSYDLLFVRDRQSINNLKELNLHLNSHVSTDLAFLKDYWLPKGLKSFQKSQSLGIILRDWPYIDEEHFSNVKELAFALKNEGFHVNFYSFDPNTDKKFREHFSRTFNFYQWNSSNSDLGLYLQELMKEALVITSRAHGAIIGACLGVPAICIEIEPKLAVVAKMLEKSAALIPYDFNVSETVELVKATLQSFEIQDDLIIADFELNNKKIMQAVEVLKAYMKKQEEKL